MSEQDLHGPEAAEYDPPDHLAHLLPASSDERPWFLDVFKNIKELVHPPKLPLLEITSKPVPLQSVQTLAKQQFTSFEVDLRPYLAQQKTHSSGGGGGAGQLFEVSKGKLPKPAPPLFTPPRVDPIAVIRNP